MQGEHNIRGVLSLTSKAKTYKTHNNFIFILFDSGSAVAQW